ncbi:MAG: serine/threonine-protein kinase [Bacteroidota bacterium]|jgi:serine/threonine-protein kinase
MNGNQFKIEHKINESATTIVYRAFDEMLHRPVLLKVLQKHLIGDDGLKQRFMREARACAALRSEHIVQVYDLTEIDGAPAIVMEFVEGRSLKDVIAAGIPEPLAVTKKTATHVLRALTVAHEKGIIHRDIKPGNILVSEKGAIKVTDFGLAYVALSPTVTMEGMVLGTPAYMAPEQVRGDEVDQRTDLFSLGVTLIEVLSGERIFEGSTYSECMKKVLVFTGEELKRFDDRSDTEFSDFLKIMLQPKKENRFASAREALNALHDTASSLFEQQSQPVRRKHTLPISLAITAIVCLVIVGLVKFVQPDTGEEGPNIQYQTPQTADSANSPLLEADQRSEKGLDNISHPPVPENVIEKSTAAVSVDSGRVFLNSTPWAKVFIDNQLIGETPIAKPVKLSAGNHSVMFANPAFDPIIKSVTVRSERDIVVTGNFLEHAGYFMCTIVPWAEIYVDEQYKDTTPLTKPIILSAGKHTVRFKNESFADQVKEIVIIAGDTTHAAVTFVQ